MRPPRNWPRDELGQILTMADELEIRFLDHQRVAISEMAKQVQLPVPLVRAVAKFARAGVESRNRAILWFGERLVEPTERVACPSCQARLAVYPCRVCRLKQYLQSQKKIADR